ncbi:MAG TPA: hypothetical protein PLP27_03110 [Crocinitomicaceae bacterium]|nr:hypothetical protein [Crocinitomicaceae bacterium]
MLKNTVFLLLILLGACTVQPEKDEPKKERLKVEPKHETSALDTITKLDTTEKDEQFLDAPTKRTKNQSLFTWLRSNKEYFVAVDIDYDLDGKKDKIFYPRFLGGDSLFIFHRDSSGYRLSLATTIYLDQGIFAMDTVKGKTINGLRYIVAYTHFNGAGGLQKDEYYYFDTEKQQWFLTHTLFTDDYCFTDLESKNADQIICEKTVCKIKQNIRLDAQTNWSKYRYVTEANKSECTVKRYPLKDE